jgi:hypothetical protein
MPIPYKALLLTLAAAIPVSCGSGRGAPVDADASRRDEPCETDPAAFATTVYGTALSQGLEGVQARHAPERALFAEMIGAQLSADDLGYLWDAHRSDLRYGVEAVRRCDGPALRITGVDVEKAPTSALEAYEVFGKTTCADGTEEQLKLKMMRFRGCLWLGAID